MLFNWLEKTLESPLNCKDTQPVHPKGDPSWVFIGRTDVEAETLILWLPDVKSWLIGKDPDSERLKAGGEGDNRGWDSSMVSEVDGYDFGWTLGVVMDREAWCAGFHGVAKNLTWLSDWTELNTEAFNMLYTYRTLREDEGNRNILNIKREISKRR